MTNISIHIQKTNGHAAPGKLADAEIHFTGGELDGLKLVGFAVWRSRDGGGSWQRLADGLPQQGAYLGVLRQAMAVDRREPVGVYIGTSTGQLYGSADEGATWRQLADHLPPISSVETVLVDA